MVEVRRCYSRSSLSTFKRRVWETDSRSGYDLGNSQSDPGQYLVSVSDGMVIYVQIQYRLGPYGWLSSKEIRANGTANAGLLDQRSAFNWVQRHIGAFGGDPDQVTIWGPSAGGSSVTNHLISYGGTAKQPFIAAIAGEENAEVTLLCQGIV